MASASATYVHDGLNRLTTIQSGGLLSKSIDYNEIGNIINREGTTYQYHSSQPHAVTHYGSLFTPQYRSTMGGAIKSNGLP